MICKLNYARIVNNFYFEHRQGASTETKPCGGPISSIWEYFFGTRIFGPHNNTDVMDEVGPGCQCGCIIHLLKSKPRRMLASSSQTCPGRNNTLWLIQVKQLKSLTICLQGV